MMDYFEACEATVTREEARREVALHDGPQWSEFLEEVGDRVEYLGEEVLGWLGY